MKYSSVWKDSTKSWSTAGDGWMEEVELKLLFFEQVIPVEGCEQVNGEDQKTFGEILHEIIISK